MQCAAESTQVCEISVAPHIKANVPSELRLPKATICGNSPIFASVPPMTRRFASRQILSTLITSDDVPASDIISVVPTISLTYSSHSEIYICIYIIIILYTLYRIIYKNLCFRSFTRFLNIYFYCYISKFFVYLNFTY